MNDIAQLIFNFVDYELFYKLKDDYKLSETLYWTNKELPNILEIIKVGHLELTKYLTNNYAYDKVKSKITAELRELPFFLDRLNFDPSECMTHAQVVNIPIEHCITAFAYHYGHLDIVKYLYEHEPIFKYEMVKMAVNQEHQHIIKFVYENIPEDIAFTKIMMLIENTSFMSEHIDICSVDKHTDGNIILSACRSGKLNILKHSKHNDFNTPYRKGGVPYYYIDIASANGHYDVVKFLLSVDTRFAYSTITLATTQQIRDLLLRNMHLCGG